MHKVCVISSTRADYGILKPLMLALKEEENIDLSIIATGMHVDKRYGFTLNEMLEDNVEVAECVEIIVDDTQEGILQTMANATSKAGQVLKKLMPDIVILLGDRYEIFALASACTVLNIPIAHIGGGELSYGAFDEVFRHCITKMSALHFTSCEEYEKRVIQLGEMPERVFCVGSLSVQNIPALQLLTKDEIDAEFGVDSSKILLTTFHPITRESHSQKEQYIELLEALVEQEEYLVLFTRANADTNACELNEILDAYALKYKEKIRVVSSLGIRKYMSVMAYCACVVGNSSSGILEAPSFKVPTLNIGNRQKGRLQAESVIQCKASKEDILKHLQNLPKRDSLKNIVNPYEKPCTKENIIKALLDFLENNASNKCAKEFYTL